MTMDSETTDRTILVAVDFVSSLRSIDSHDPLRPYQGTTFSGLAWAQSRRVRRR